MDTRNNYSQIIKKILISYTEIPYNDLNIKFETVFDTEQDRYLLMLVGSEQVNYPFPTTKRVHGCLIHVDIIDDKIWIQRDGTERGIATDLLEAGIPKNKIVLAFYAPEIREETGFALLNFLIRIKIYLF
ncbi:XisI protein [Geminocystis sp. GBBB08]|uniref:XisI protein n=1 Tax=Geminocystis sp. GBBB08 TaxID=2604140 RepID=UPI0027E2AC3C|nr:XisI protein [Geminocystis sp. GBBB08]MBL1208384.1 XisI protein [Geminocystis sp. GBBB08]